MSLSRYGDCGQSKTVPQKKHGQIMLKKQHIGSKKTYGHKNTEQSKHIDAKDRKLKCSQFT